MEIRDLKIRQGKVDVVVTVTDVSEPREFSKFGVAGKVATATVKDNSGETKLTLWNDDAVRVKKGMKIHVINGWVGEYQGEMQLTAGKFGKVEIVGEGEALESGDEKAEAKLLEPKKADSSDEDSESDEEEVLDNVEEEKVE